MMPKKKVVLAFLLSESYAALVDRFITVSTTRTISGLSPYTFSEVWGFVFEVSR
jgi:hypothetical protein